MDKWDELLKSIADAGDADDGKLAGIMALKLLGEFARTIEQMGADLDRIATALEARNAGK